MMVDQGPRFFWCRPPGPWRDWMPGGCSTAQEHTKICLIFFPATVLEQEKGKPLPVTSMIVDPGGEVLAEGGEDACYVSAEIDPERVNGVRNEFSALNDRVF